MPAVERDRAAQKPGDGHGLLVGEHFDVGQAGGVVDADMHVIPAGALAAVAAGAPAEHPVPGAAANTPELLDVDVDQLAGLAALVAVGRLKRLQSRELAQPDPGEHRRDGRERHAQAKRNLRPSHPQPPQCGDRLDELLRSAMRHRARRRGTIQQPALAVGPIAGDPLRAGALAHSGGLGRLRERPLLLEHPPHHRQPALRTERRVSVNLHPVSSLGLGLQHHPASKGARMNNVVRNYS